MSQGTRVPGIELSDNESTSQHSSNRATAHRRRRREVAVATATSAAPLTSHLERTSRVSRFSDRSTPPPQAWVAVHHVRKNRSLCWTHFLCRDSTLSEVKCKHCGRVLTTDKSRSKSSTSRYRSHLRIQHRIDPDSDYYAQPAARTNAASAGGAGALLPSSSPRAAGSLQLPAAKSSEPAEAGSREFAPVGHVQDVLVPPRIAGSTLSRNDLVVLVCIVHNLQPSFLTDRCVRALFGLVSDPPVSVPVPYPAPSLFRGTVGRLATLADIPLRTTLARDAIALCSCRDSLQLLLHEHPIRSQARDSVRRAIKALYQVTFFSLAQSIWSPPPAAAECAETTDRFNVTCSYLSFFDSHSVCQRQLVVAVGSEIQSSRLLHSPPGANASDKGSSAVQRALSQNGDLGHVLLSFTTARSNMPGPMAPLHERPSLQRRECHICVVSALNSCILPAFGHFHGLCQVNSSKYAYAARTSTPNPLDAIVSLEGVDITNTLFDNIAAWKQELAADPWKFDKFLTLCNRRFGERAFDTSTYGVLTFDPARYSTAEATLHQFLQLQPVVQSMDEYITSRKFTSLDYDTMLSLRDILRAHKNLVLYFSSDAPTFTYVLQGMHSFQNHLEEQLYLSGARNPFLTKLLRRMLANTNDYIQIMTADDQQVIGFFFAVTSLFDGSMLNSIFHTETLTEIVETVVEGVHSLLGRWLAIQDSQDFSNGVTSAVDSRYTLNGYSDLDIVAENSTISDGDDLDRLTKSIIREDIYHYLRSANSMVPNIYEDYCQEYSYVKVEEHYEKTDAGNDTRLNSVDELLSIHIPVSELFWQKFTIADSSAIKIIRKIMCTECATSILSSHAFLRDQEIHTDQVFFENVVKLKTFNKQFDSSKIDFENHSLSTVCKLSVEKPVL